MKTKVRKQLEVPQAPPEEIIAQLRSEIRSLQAVLASNDRDLRNAREVLKATQKLLNGLLSEAADAEVAPEVVAVRHVQAAMLRRLGWLPVREVNARIEEQQANRIMGMIGEAAVAFYGDAAGHRRLRKARK